MSTTFTRSQFATACKAYVAKHDGKNPVDLSAPIVNSSCWSWKEHPSVPNWGYLSREVLLPFSSTEHQEIEDDDNPEYVVEAEDDAATSPTAGAIISCHQHVVFSPTFQVPTFYFTVYQGNGTPLSLDAIVKTPLFRPHILSNVESTSFALTDTGSAFPLLSQGDHPVLGTPSWYLHPCHTAETVEEVMAEIWSENWTEEDRLLRWLEAWFMVLEQVVDLRSRSFC